MIDLPNFKLKERLRRRGLLSLLPNKPPKRRPKERQKLKLRLIERLQRPRDSLRRRLPRRRLSEMLKLLLKRQRRKLLKELLESKWRLNKLRKLELRLKWLRSQIALQLLPITIAS
jgi:hypothetical protein